MKCIVTGGSAGLGAALVEIMVNAGHDVLAIGRRPRSAVDVPHHRYLQADLATAEGIAKVVDAVAPWRRLDRLVHNAAIGKVADVDGHQRADISGQIALNLMAPMALTHALFDRLAAARGQVVFVSSTAVRRAQPTFPVYTASKAALDAFARNLRTEVGDAIGVTVHHPGPMRTGFHARAGLAPGPLHRFFTPPAREAARLARRMSLAA